MLQLARSLLLLGMTSTMLPATGVSVCIAEPPSDAAPDTESRLLARVGDGFRTRTTEHFVVAFDTPYPELRSLMGRLEGTFIAVTHFCENADLPVEPLEERLGVIFYNRREDFERFLEQAKANAHGVAGLYDPRSNTAAFCSTRANPAMEPIRRQIDRLQKRLESSGHRDDALRRQLSILRARQSAIVETYNRLVVQHEAAHHILFNFGVHRRGAKTPRWLAEGLACQFEVAQPSLRKGELEINHSRLADLREALGVDRHARNISEALSRQAFQNGRILRLEELVSEPDGFASAGDSLVTWYAQAWGLVYYLHREHTAGFSDYVTTLAARQAGRAVTPEDERQAFESHFGPLDGAFQRRWLEHLVRLRLDVHRAGR